MITTVKPYRYQLPKKAIKADCPQCGPRHRKTLSRYIDTKTGEPLPESYGRCDRESNCGYSLSPYQKTASGMSYADEDREQSQMPPIPKKWFRMAGKWKRNGTSRRGMVEGFQDPLIGATAEEAERIARFIFDKPLQPTQPTQTSRVYAIPDEIVKQSLGHYQQNQFARLLIRQFGQTKAHELLYRFQIGTSSRWSGACVFWLTDEQYRARSGQVVLFADDWHKAHYTDQEGNPKVCISSVSHGLLRRYRQKQETPPDWLTDYHNDAPRWPVLFGLHQLADVPIDTPIAIVEAPKTAVVCSALIPGFVWLAAGALSYLNVERLAPLRGRSIRLFPDLSKDGKAFVRWSKVADELNTKGYQIGVSDYLEQRASTEQKEKGLDLADFLLIPNQSRPNNTWLLDGRMIYGEVLEFKPCDSYPPEWDKNIEHK
ncbi:DUF6371 domain-containing protein [Spirosoma telluris]|uniref:DUF6371 domain-containing protein n=1 Tax=Spirosoma telluris TaxID=2183553 RepID=UPI0018DC117C